TGHSCLLIERLHDSELPSLRAIQAYPYGFSKNPLAPRNDTNHAREPVLKRWRGLFPGETLEVGHLAFHLFASRVGGGADALDAQLEFVGVGRAHERFVDGDELLVIEIEERLVEGLHAVL